MPKNSRNGIDETPEARVLRSMSKRADTAPPPRETPSRNGPRFGLLALSARCVMATLAPEAEAVKRLLLRIFVANSSATQSRLRSRFADGLVLVTGTSNLSPSSVTTQVSGEL